MAGKVAILTTGTGASKTANLARWIAGEICKAGIAIDLVNLDELNGLDLLCFAMESTSVRRLTCAVEDAHGVVVATPIYKASFSGLVKLALDVLPQFGFAGKVVLPVATAGGLAHALALDYALRPVLQSMAARHVVQSTVVSEADWGHAQTGLVPSEKACDMLGRAVEHFLFALDSRAEVAALGLPRSF